MVVFSFVDVNIFVLDSDGAESIIGASHLGESLTHFMHHTQKLQKLKFESIAKGSESKMGWNGIVAFQILIGF